MKYLGIDFGTKHIGVAISDDLGQIAFPKTVLKNDTSLLENIRSVIEQESVDAIVLGESINEAGVANSVHAGTKELAALLEQGGYTVYFEKEFWSSFEAHGREGKERFAARKQKVVKTTGLDAKAAAVILQRFLDRK
ncbi:MAG: Holliday junction resolvase RuvX [Candidatus Paceibacterota bacterium]